MHRYSHAAYTEMVEILNSGGREENKVQEIYKEIVDSCLVCVRSRPLRPSRKVSPTPVCLPLNVEITVDYMLTHILKTKYYVLHMVDTGARYSEVSLVWNRSEKIMASTVKVIYILRYGVS